MLARLVKLFKQHWLGIRVIGTFLTLIVVFYFVLDYGPIVDRFDIGGWLARQAAWMSFGILRGIGRVAGFDIWREGTIMGSGPFEVDVAPACSGAVPTSIYLAAVLAYPAGWRPKLIGSLLGIVAIHVVNLLRVAALFLIGLYFREIFHETHVYVAQSLVVCFAIALWLFWATKFTHASAAT